MITITTFDKMSKKDKNTVEVEKNLYNINNSRIRILDLATKKIYLDIIQKPKNEHHQFLIECDKNVKKDINTYYKVVNELLSFDFIIDNCDITNFYSKTKLIDELKFTSSNKTHMIIDNISIPIMYNKPSILSNVIIINSLENEIIYRLVKFNNIGSYVMFRILQNFGLNSVRINTDNGNLKPLI